MSSGNATDDSQYGYQPSLGIGIVGVTLFTLSSMVHVYQLWIFRSWWLIVLVIGGITEIIGYSARIYSWHDDSNLDAFLAQTVTLIIAPSFFSAALYVVFGQIVHITGRQYSILAPKWYTIIFVIADLISLIVQSIGGGKAADAATSNSDTTDGTHIMVAARNMKIFLTGMSVITLMIFIRCIYRTVELLDGWTGYIITHEVFFACLDGLPMIIALTAFNIFHPGLYLKKEKSVKGVDPVS
ncbi:hypothetical protein I4U23_011204 [Adineta vaga]|nr:hypothetical protein I4U23_011204 [Adineta vaga]